MKILLVYIFAAILPAVSLLAPRSQITGYWFWAGKSVLEKPLRQGIYYVHQGTLERSTSTSSTRFLPQGASPVKTSADEIYLVFRIEALEQQDAIAQSAVYLIKRWEQAGNAVTGIQLDYDSPTRRLGDYIQYLKTFRLLLPSRYRLSVTGLADWAANSPHSILYELSHVADEIVFQLYNGRQPIANIPLYLGRLKTVDIPFRLGILEGMSEQHESYNEIKQKSNFHGFVYFLTATQQRKL